MLNKRNFRKFLALHKNFSISLLVLQKLQNSKIAFKEYLLFFFAFSLLKQSLMSRLSFVLRCAIVIA